MPLFNLTWQEGGFFWDGRVATLREQVLHPLQDPNEMGLDLWKLPEILRNILAWKKHSRLPSATNA